MGDHRCIIRLEVEDFHGVSRKAEMNINWMGEDDDRITQWFRDVHDDGMYAYQESMAEYYKERRIEEEKAQLTMLQERYPKEV